MARTARDVTESELNILEVLWKQGASGVRRIIETLGMVYSASQAATIQKLLERLEDKGWVERDRTGEVQQFRATRQREDLLGSRLETLADELCEGSMTPILNHLVRKQKLTESDRQKLREIIDSLDQSEKRRKI